MITGPWREVIDRAGGRCECRGECGRKHTDGTAGRCKREHDSTAPLHAVPREPTPTRLAASLPAEAVHALCDPCHGGAARKQAARRRAEAAQAAGDSLF